MICLVSITFPSTLPHCWAKCICYSRNNFKPTNWMHFSNKFFRFRPGGVVSKSSLEFHFFFTIYYSYRILLWNSEWMDGYIWFYYNKNISRYADKNETYSLGKRRYDFSLICKSAINKSAKFCNQWPQTVESPISMHRSKM